MGMSDELRLFGSRAIVTGAGNGIGEAIVRTFVKQGASVFAVDKPDSGVDTRFKSMRNVTPLAASVDVDDSLDNMIAQASGALDGLDIIVNNSLLQASAPIADSDTEELRKFLDRRIRLYAATARLALPYLEKSPAGRIINMGCIRSAFTRDGERSFTQSRSALAELTRTLAVEAGPNGTTVNYVQPGAVMTPASRRVFNDDKALRDHCIGQSAAKRLGEPVDIAKVILFLASDDAVFVSGTGIIVDGGKI